jgi:hypothetical protein
MTLRDASWRACAALAALVFLTLLLSLAHLERYSLPALAALLALVVLAARRPSTALLVLAVLIPVASWLGRRWEPSVAWAEALVVAFSAGYFVRASLATRGKRDDLDLPVLLSATVIFGSLIAQFLIDGWRFGGVTVREYLWQLVTHDYLRIGGSGDPVDAAMRLLESLVLVKAASAAARADAAFGPLLARSFVFGASAAGAINVLRLWEGALRLESPVATFGRYLLSQRFNAHYGDVNAAGSYFMMALFPALALAWPRKKRLRPERGANAPSESERGWGPASAKNAWQWGIAALLVAIGLWIAGSRTSFVAGVVAMAVPAAVLARRIASTTVKRVTLAAAALLLIAISVPLARSIPGRMHRAEPGVAAQIRWELAQTSFRMLAAAPAFGVGIGRYYSKTGEFSSPELLRIFPSAIHENAHNNFLQILAELGLIGLAAVIWLLAIAARACVRLLQADPRDPLRWGIVTGLLAFVLSWLGGHPLLIDEPAFSFWLLLGAVSGWGSTTPPQRGRWLVWIVGVLTLAVAASIPLRVRAERAEFNLEHLGIGLSAWQSELDGVRYRRAGVTSSVFVPSGTDTAIVPLRAVGPREDLRVELWLDGRPADVIRVRSDRWLNLQLLLRQRRDTPRFHRLEFRVSDASPAEPVVLMIGKVQPR